MSDDSHFSIHPVYRSRAAIPAIVVMAFSPDGQRLAFGDVVGRLVIMRDILGSCVRDFDSLLTAEQPITSLSWLAPFVQCGAIHTPQVLRPADLIVGDEQGFIHVLLPKSTACTVRMRAHEQRILHITSDTNTGIIATATKSEVRIWTINQYGRLDPRSQLTFPEGPLKGIRSVGFGKSYIHVSDESCTTFAFDKWTNVVLSTASVDVDSVANAVWIADNNGSPVFALNDRYTGFILQSGNNRVTLPYPTNVIRSSVLAVNSTATRLVGGGCSGVVLVYDCTSGKQLQALSDPLITEHLNGKASATSVAIGTFKKQSLVAACSPINKSGDLSLIIWAQVVPGRPHARLLYALIPSLAVMGVVAAACFISRPNLLHFLAAFLV